MTFRAGEPPSSPRAHSGSGPARQRPRAAQSPRGTGGTGQGPPGGEALLTPAEVAALFRVDPKTVTRWAKAGKLTSIRTLGGHRRYRESEVTALLMQSGPDPDPRPPSAQSP